LPTPQPNLQASRNTTACQNGSARFIAGAGRWKPTKCKMVLVRRRDRQSGGRELIVQPDRNYPNAWRRSPYYEELKAQCGQIRIQIIVSDRCNVMMCPDQDVYFGPNTEAVMFDGVGRVKGVLPIEEARKYILDSN